MTTAAREVDSSVWDILGARRASGSLPCQRDDAFRVGLAIEGGAMRGVISAAMAAGLDELGLRNAFDLVAGASAGAITSAYFVAGQAELCVPSYYEEMTTRDFIDFRRIARGRAPVSLEFVLDVVAERIRPLDWGAILASPITLAVVATAVESAESTAFTAFGDKAQLKAALKESSRLPVIAGDPGTIDGKRYLDAGVTEAIPVLTAIKEGCTHVLVLRTRPDGTPASPPGWFDRRIVAPRLRRLNPGLASAYLKRRDVYNRLSETLDEPIAVRRAALGAAVDSLRMPAGVPSVSTTERVPAIIRQAAANAYAFTLAQMSTLLETHG